MIKIIICDDEKIFRDKLNTMLREFEKVKMLELEIKSFASGVSLLNNTEDWIYNSDILFMDIRLGEENGIDIASQARKEGFRGEIIFLSASPEYVFRSFEAKPLTYLLKNEMHLDKFMEEFEKIFTTVGDMRFKLFLFQVSKEKYVVHLKDIVLFEVKKRIIKLVYVDREGHFCESGFYSTLENIEEKLGSAVFLKPHRSFLINPAFISRISSAEVALKSGEHISVTRKYRKDLISGFDQYLENIGVNIF
ncbi:MAG: LytR/AlgR family response regulator transcription factor [Lachnospiraceae bacterium]